MEAIEDMEKRKKWLNRRNKLDIKSQMLITIYIGRNAQNLKKWIAGYTVVHYHYKSSCRS